MKVLRPRRSDLLVTKLDDEVVVYDPERKQAHSLNRLAVAVWNHAGNAKTVEELHQNVSQELDVAIDRSAVVDALRMLERAQLVATKLSASAGMTRRDALKKAGRYGAAAVVATPIIASALVPVAAAAASVCVGPGSPGNTAGATCGATCQCLKTMTPTGPGSPVCVDYTGATLTLCGPRPGGYIQCPTGKICVEVDGSLDLGLCFAPCSTPTCTC